MSPEKRADALFGRVLWCKPDDGPGIKRELARAIRAAENAALERARAVPVKAFVGRNVNGPDCEWMQEQIRSLKSRAPKRKAGRA